MLLINVIGEFNNCGTHKLTKTNMHNTLTTILKLIIF